MKKIIAESTITCPKCSHQSKEVMPTDACQFFWECPACGTVTKPKEGDCCVFCSYGDVACPPIQQDKSCC
ncbi:MAG: GDCCVxC domain-containing (seleno)protein [Balneolaceae bacterium]